jgi:hypothetical protein
MLLAVSLPLGVLVYMKPSDAVGAMLVVLALALGWMVHGLRTKHWQALTGQRIEQDAALPPSLLGLLAGRLASVTRPRGRRRKE